MSSLSQAATAAEKRTNARYWIVVMLFIVTSFNYGDRATLSIAGSEMAKDIGLDPVGMGYVFSAFSWAYVIGQIPGGWLLDRPAALCRGLVGYGYYTVAPVLLLVSYILLFHRGRNVTACVVGAALLPVLLGAMLHLVLCKTDYNSVDGIAKLLWQSGLSMESGGVLSATLAIMLVKLVKKTLAMILLAVLLVTCLMLAFRLTPAAVL